LRDIAIQTSQRNQTKEVGILATEPIDEEDTTLMIADDQT
jgi:hypothetical protein